MRRRSAFTMIETMTAVAVGGLLLTAITLFAHQFLQAAHEIEMNLDFHDRLERLGERFREDVRAAETVAVDAAGDAFTIEPSGEREIRYRANEKWVVRRELEKDKAVSEERALLPPGSVVRFEIDSARAALLLLTRGDRGRGSAKTLRRIEATIGSDRRFLKERTAP